MTDPRRLLVAIGDVHAGGSVAALRKPISHQDGPMIHPGPINELIAEKMQRAAEWAAGEAKRLAGGGDVQGSIPVVLLHNGDLTEGIHHHTHQILIPEDVGPQLEIAHDLLGIFLDALTPTAILFTIGTEAHVGKGGAYESAVAKRLVEEGHPVLPAPDTGRLVAQHHEVVLGGHRILAFHHGKMGGTPGTKGSMLSLKARDFYLDACLVNDGHRKRNEPESPIPSLIIGSHHHQRAESGNQFPTAWIQLPPWTYRNTYAHRVAAAALEEVGLATVLCDPDRDRPEHRWWTWQPRRASCAI